MDKHVHTDECWEPDSGCDIGRNEEFAVRCSPEVEKEINEAIDQWLTKEPPAYITDPDTRYNARYDGYYNIHTHEWLERKCSDAECEFCSERPEKAPLESEDYKGLVYPTPDLPTEDEREQYIWGSNAAYEYADRLRGKNKTNQ